MVRRLPLLLSVLLLLTVCDSAWAGPATERLKEVFASANRILADPATEDSPLERLAAIRRLVNEVVDWHAAGAHALGPEWRARPRVEQQEFTRLFADLLERMFVMAMASRAGVSEGLRVAWRGERADGAGAVVSSMVTGRSGATFPVEYRMVEVGGVWRIRDVVVEGVSLVENYRAQFVAVLRRSSYADLVSEMRSRASTVVALEPPPADRPVIAAAEKPSIPPPAAGAAPMVAPSAPVSPPRAFVAAPVSSRSAPPVAPVVVASTPSATAPTPPAPVVVAAQPTVPLPAIPAPVAARPAPERPASASVAARPAPQTYWVQVGAFQSVDAATRLAQQLKSWALTIAVKPFSRTLGADQLTRVLVGPFRERGQATAALGRLQARGLPGFVTEDRR
jgi:phospholipid transport system substrate-binding protein